MTQFWTIDTPDGPYTSDHPQITGAKIASLFHDRRLADEMVAHDNDPARLTVREVGNREEWGSMIVGLKITHIDEYILDTYHQTHDAEFWLATIRSRIMAGRATG